jgi:hypothetical protein
MCAAQDDTVLFEATPQTRRAAQVSTTLLLRSRFGGPGALVFLHRRSFRRCAVCPFFLTRAVASKASSATAVFVASACGVFASAFDSGSGFAFADTSAVPHSGRLTSLSFVIFILSGDGKSFSECGSPKMKKAAPKNFLLRFVNIFCESKL